MNKIFWLTGLPCSGKTTIAKELARRIDAEILDGDDLRTITNNQDFSKEGREIQTKGVAELAYRLSKYTNVVVALVSPYRDVRDEIKKKYSNLVEIFVKCPVDNCIKRDVKGMYKKALAGEIKNFTGIDGVYEEPNIVDANIVMTDILTINQCVDKILKYHYDFKDKDKKEYNMVIL